MRGRGFVVDGSAEVVAGDGDQNVKERKSAVTFSTCLLPSCLPQLRKSQA